MLFQPFTLRKLEIRNRLWVPPMCQYAVSERDGVPRDWHLLHIGGFARGGAGLIIVEATAVVPEGRISPEDLGLWNDVQADAFARLADIAHEHQAKIAVQLAHAGRKASSYAALPGLPNGSVPLTEGGWQTVAPSPIAYSDEYAEPRELSRGEIANLVKAFVAAATRAVRAGFDAVEIHAAHGYLLNEFLTPLSNRRHDEYGGSLENRARFVREVIRAVRAAHPDLPIIVRISATDWVPGGFTIEDAAIVTDWFAEDGADLINVSSGATSSDAVIPVGPGYQVALAAHVRRGKLPVAAVGKITSAVQAESILASGQADAILVGRPMLANPHLPIHWAHELRAASAPSLVPPHYHRASFVG